VNVVDNMNDMYTKYSNIRCPRCTSPAVFNDYDDAYEGLFNLGPEHLCQQCGARFYLVMEQ